jgi:hypothetical protein
MLEEAFPSSHNALPLMSSLLPSLLNNLHSGAGIFKPFMEPRNRCQGINSASLCSLAGPYDNPIPSRCLAPIDFLKIPALRI